MNEKQEILIEILASGDRAFMPIRQWTRNHPANRYFSMKRYPFVAWRGGGSDTNRKRAQLLLEDLVAEKMVERFREKTKTTMVSLTSAAVEQIRKLCGLPDMSTSLRALRALAGHCDRKPRTLERLWVAEIDLNDGKGWDGMTDHNEQLGWICEAMLPALQAGFVFAGSDYHGRAYYSITPAGWGMIDKIADQKFKPFKVTEVGSAVCSEGAYSLYVATLKTDLRRMQDMDPEETGEIGFIPLPVSMHGLQPHDSATPPAASPNPAPTAWDAESRAAADGSDQPGPASGSSDSRSCDGARE